MVTVAVVASVVVGLLFENKKGPSVVSRIVSLGFMQIYRACKFLVAFSNVSLPAGWGGGVESGMRRGGGKTNTIAI